MAGGFIRHHYHSFRTSFEMGVDFKICLAIGKKLKVDDGIRRRRRNELDKIRSICVGPTRILVGGYYACE